MFPAPDTANIVLYDYVVVVIVSISHIMARCPHVVSGHEEDK